MSLLLVASYGATLTGCSSGSSEPESIASADRVTELVEMRKLYDKVGGDWAALSPAEQEQYNKMAGDAEKGKTMWASMANPTGATPAPK